MRIFRKNKEIRQQALIPMGETTTKGNYISEVIKHKYYNFYNIDHRYAVCMLDAIGRKLTYEWAKRVVAKTFKFYDSHEVDGVEVMEDIRAKWVELNCDEILKKCITPMVRDGYVLLDLQKKDESIDYDVYGEFECPPKLWWIDTNNKIIGYQIQFVPRPRAIGSSALLLGQTVLDGHTHNLRMVNDTKYPKDIIHIEFGEPNYGCGMPLIEGVWDCIQKLSGESHQEMMDRRTIPTLHLTEDDYDTENTEAKGMLKMVANSDQDTARVWYHKRISSKPGEYSEYPKFAYESPTANQNYNTRNQNQGISTGDFGNVNKEWTRLCTITGHSIRYFLGNRPGAETGAETDKTEDDDQEIIDFGQIEIIIRKILDWLDAQGLIIIPKEPFVIKYWKDWERIELMAKNKEEMLAATEAQPGDDVEIDKQDNDPVKENSFEGIEMEELIKAIREHMSYVMTPVVSHWIAEIGYYDVNDRLYMLLLDGKVYSKPAPMGEWSFIDWRESGSKGRYFWEYLSQRDPPWMRDTIPNEIASIGAMVGNKSRKVAILDYKLIDSLDTEGKIKKLGKEVKWGMGTGTATHIKELLNSLKKNATKHQLRFNTMTAEAFGNSIKEHYPLLYDTGDGIIVEEYICPDSWKENVGKIVPLGVYHNMDEWNTPELPDWQIVGNAEIFGWDDEDGSDYVKFNYDYDKIDSVFRKLDYYDWLTAALKENGTSDISTAYYCDIEIQWNEKLDRFIRVQVNIELISISFVPKGNCPGEVCSIKVMAKNTDAMQTYIKKCIDEGEEREVCLAHAYTKFKAKT